MKRHIGVLSDTHGLLRGEVLSALDGSELIIHAGDVGSPDVLEALAKIAPVFAIRGNVDKGSWAGALPETRVVEFQAISLYVLHDINALDLKPAAAGFGAVISGHTHKSRMQILDGVLYLNPGSAGPRRFRLPVSIAKLRVADGKVDAEILELAG
jgi:putative phosphoesterase